MSNATAAPPSRRRPIPELWTTKQVADYFGISPDAVRVRIYRGQLRPLRVPGGKGHRFDADAIRRMAEPAPPIA